MKCKICGKTGNISRTLTICLECIRTRWDIAEPLVISAHHISRKQYSLPLEPPKSLEGVPCGLCVNNCKLSTNEVGYCGLRINQNGKIQNLTGRNAVLEYYYDYLPTNCVAMEFCESRNFRFPCKNLSVFYGACTFNCLFCQNWHYRYLVKYLKPVISPEELASKVDTNTKCVCYFGGDPTPQILHAIETSKIILQNNTGIKICVETNGSLSSYVLKNITELCYSSRGTIKFDLKTYTENLNIALCGVSNKTTLDNFKTLAENYQADFNFLVASTLLVPEYIDEHEVELIAKFISEISKKIPYNLLAFYPQFYMSDMICTPKELAFKCYKIATKYLEYVRIGNIHLLI